MFSSCACPPAVLSRAVLCWAAGHMEVPVAGPAKQKSAGLYISRALQAPIKAWLDKQEEEVRACVGDACRGLEGDVRYYWDYIKRKGWSSMGRSVVCLPMQRCPLHRQAMMK